jgi:subtilisin family serine protease
MKATKSNRTKSGNVVMPKKIFAQASPKSIGGVSMFDSMNSINFNSVGAFQSERQYIDASVNRLREAGFEILQVTNFTINIAGNQELFEKAFKTKLVVEDRPVIKPGGIKDIGQFIECPDTPQPGFISTKGTVFEDVLEGVAIEEPRYFMAASMFPPMKSYWHLDVPAGISLGLNADKAHRGGITGHGLKVAMVDTGHYDHPFFSGRGYRVAPVILGPAASNPLKDEEGHGTAESANIFAVAPDVELLPVKMSFVNTIGAFNTAVALNPDIITCSWGSSIMHGPLSAADQALAAAVSAAWASGIVVIFSAGNGHYGFPSQHPDCIAAGGVFMDKDESLRASDYASGFMSNIYTGRRVPDVCGLVGMKPRAAYIMLPLEPGDNIDQSCQGGTHPNGDETTGTDGWAAISGTSAAAPQLAGLAALIKEACPKLSNTEVRDVMMKSARDVTTGNCNTSCGGSPATVGPDTATGYGLADANKAVLLAKIRCLGTIARGPVRGPVRTIEPPSVEPVRTIIPREPGPIGPNPPVPPRPDPGPVRPTGSSTLSDVSYSSTSLEAQSSIHGKLTKEDIQTLEDMLLKGTLNI